MQGKYNESLLFCGLEGEEMLSRKLERNTLTAPWLLTAWKWGMTESALSLWGRSLGIANGSYFSGPFRTPEITPDLWPWGLPASSLCESVLWVTNVKMPPLAEASVTSWCIKVVSSPHWWGHSRSANLHLQFPWGPLSLFLCCRLTLPLYFFFFDSHMDYNANKL